MKTKLLLATHNVNKVNEIRQILNENKFEIISLKDLNDNDDVVEDGATFYDNALIKATHFFKKYHITTLADDSGLVVPSLGGLPGVNSKRFSNGDDNSNNDKLLKMLENNLDNRTSYFETTVVLIKEDNSIHSFRGKLEGVIGFNKEGNEGFGYDPIFIPRNYHQTLATIGNNIKNKISHRAKAFKKVEEYLNENFNN